VKRCLLALSLLAAIWSHAAVALGQTVRGEDFLPAGGPVVWETGLAWGERAAAEEIQILGVGSPEARRELLTLRPVGPNKRLHVELAGSATHLIASATEAEACVRCLSEPRSTIYSRRPDGSTERLAGTCAINSGLRDFDLSGALLVARAATCAYARYDLAQSNQPQSELPTNIRAPRIAGRYVAWLEGFSDEPSFASTSDLVVHDSTEQRELYRVPAAAIPGPVRSLDLQADGKLAFVYATLDGGRVTAHVAWASPQEPHPHPILLPGRRQYAVRIASDRLVYVGSDRERFRDGAIGFADLDGNAQWLASPVTDEGLAERFDFDGQRLAWVHPGCTYASIRSMRVTDPPVLRGERAGCALRLSRPPRRQRDGRWSFLLDCRSFVGQCGTRRVVLRGALQRGQRPRILGVGTTRDFSHRVSVALRPGARRVLRRRGYLRVDASAVITDASGERERRSRAVRLRR